MIFLLKTSVKNLVVYEHDQGMPEDELLEAVKDADGKAMHLLAFSFRC